VLRCRELVLGSMSCWEALSMKSGEAPSLRSGEAPARFEP